MQLPGKDSFQQGKANLPSPVPNKSISQARPKKDKFKEGCWLPAERDKNLALKHQ